MWMNLNILKSLWLNELNYCLSYDWMSCITNKTFIWYWLTIHMVMQKLSYTSDKIFAKEGLMFSELTINFDTHFYQIVNTVFYSKF